MIKVGEKYNINEFAELGRRGIQYIVNKQNFDGSWFYAGSPERPTIDCFHQSYILQALYSVKDNLDFDIGSGTKFGYGGVGVIIHSDAVIGGNCAIGQQVTIGGGNSKYPGVPKIGNNVRIHKGAIVFGGITIGANAEIGANAVVNKPVPDNAVVAGVPAKILRFKE